MDALHAPDFPAQATRRRPSFWLRVLVPLVLMFLFLWNLERVPAMQWDEGWTLTVARTWVERGHYGRLLNGELAPPGLEAAFPVTGPVALCFQLLGVGVWQGRLVAVLFTMAALATLYGLARVLYSRSIAVGAVAAALFMTPHLAINPLLIGRMVMAELPMLFYLLAGYLCFFLGVRRSLWYLVPAILMWAIGLITKAQPLPFWALSLFIPMLIAITGRRWKQAVLLGASLAGALSLARGLPVLQQSLLSGHTLPSVRLDGLLYVTGWVPVLWARVAALAMVLVAGIPTLTGWLYEARRWIIHREWSGSDEAVALVRLMLLVFVGSWFAWFTFLSVGWLRYLFPAVFVGCIFVAAALSALTGQFDPGYTVRSSSQMLAARRLNREGMAALLASILIAMSFPATILAIGRAYVMDSGGDAAQIATYVNSQTPAAALVEAYDTEIFFLLDRRYHYPPDETNIHMIQRSDLGQDVSYGYDPLAADPDYLIIGPMARSAGLYQSVLTGAFRPVFGSGPYQVYERIRELPAPNS